MLITDTGGIQAVDIGIASRAIPGQNVSGDLCTVQPRRDGVLLAVIDGLGHGEPAAAAARRAVNTIATHASDPIDAIVTRCHAELMGTRGAVMSLAEVNTYENTVTWLAIGNVEGVLHRGAPGSRPRFDVVMQSGGVVGFNLPPLRPRKLPINREDTLVLATDGIGRGFEREIPEEKDPQAQADHICRKFARGDDDALVLVVRYAHGTP